MQAARQTWTEHYAAGSPDQSRPPRKTVQRSQVSVASNLEPLSVDSSRIELYPSSEELEMEQESQFSNRKRAQEVAEAIKSILNEEALLVTRRLDISRPQFAEMISKRAGRTVSNAMLRNWTSPSQPHQIPLWAFIAWYQVVRNRTTLDKVLSLMGLTSKTGEEAEMIGLARQIIQRERLTSEIGIRMAALHGREDAA